MQSSIDRFREFVRIESVSGSGVSSGSYRKAVDLLKSWMKELAMTNIREIEYTPGKLVLIGTILGGEPTLPSILLNGHYDVVPANTPMWTHPPFDGAMTPDGRIYGRGTQDMKCVDVQYLEALRILKNSNPSFRLKRTVHVSFLPDEEVGGLEGASLFVSSNEFRDLNVGIALDEGLANPSNAYSLFHGERASNWVIIRAKGPTGHGSRFVKDTAIEKMSRILTRIYSMRRGEEHRCHSHDLKLGDVLSMNVTAMKAGVASSTLRGGFAINVIPSEAEIAIDIRVPLDVDDIESIIRDSWIQGEEGVEVDFVDRNEHPAESLLSKPLENNKYVAALMNGIRAVHGAEFRIDLDVFPAGTDGRYMRLAGVPCLGFSPIRNTPILLHDNDEYIDAKNFMEGIYVYKEIILELGNRLD